MPFCRRNSVTRNSDLRVWSHLHFALPNFAILLAQKAYCIHLNKRCSFFGLFFLMPSPHIPKSLLLSSRNSALSLGSVFYTTKTTNQSRIHSSQPLILPFCRRNSATWKSDFRAWYHLNFALSSFDVLLSSLKGLLHTFEEALLILCFVLCHHLIYQVAIFTSNFTALCNAVKLVK